MKMCVGASVSILVCKRIGAAYMYVYACRCEPICMSMCGHVCMYMDMCV